LKKKFPQELASKPRPVSCHGGCFSDLDGIQLTGDDLAGGKIAWLRRKEAELGGNIQVRRTWMNVGPGIQLILQ
jgi:hypothetical protein